MLGEREQFRWIALSCLRIRNIPLKFFKDKKEVTRMLIYTKHKIMDIDNKNIIEMFMASGGDL
mgnify:CR=1 FL=1